MSRVSPGLPGAVIGQGSSTVWVEGRHWEMPDIRVSPAQYQEFRQGYRCVICLGAQPSAFPDKCVEPYCEFPIRARQLWVLDQNTEEQGPHVIDEIAADEQRREALREQGVYIP